MKMTKNLKKTKDIINGHVCREENHKFKKYLWHIIQGQQSSVAHGF